MRSKIDNPGKWKKQRKKCRQDCRLKAVRLKYAIVKMDPQDKKKNKLLLKEQEKKIRQVKKDASRQEAIAHFYNMKQLLSDLFFFTFGVCTSHTTREMQTKYKHTLTQ